MCRACEPSKAVKMGEKVVQFLVDHHELPAFKKQDDKVKEAEERLANRLINMQAGLEQAFIDELRTNGLLPENDEERKRLIARIMDTSFENMKEAIVDEGLDIAEVGRQMTFDDFASQGLSLEFTSFSEEVKDELYDKIYEFSDDTFSRIKGDFRKTLAEGYAEGLGIDDIADELGKDFDNLRNGRLQTIARTEIQGAQNEGSHRTMQEHNVEFEQWLTVNDDRVRDDGEVSHVILHGEVVRVGEAFSNGLMYPGDRSGVIGEWINCRCRVRPYLPKEDEHITSTPYFPNAA